MWNDMTKVEGREDSNLEGKKEVNECLTTNRKSCYMAAQVLCSRWQKFKCLNKGEVEGGDMGWGIDNVFCA
jgi:hypothetical protein